MSSDLAIEQTLSNSISDLPMEQIISNDIDKESQIELEPLDSRGIYLNPQEGTITRKEILKNLCNRVLRSKVFLIFYIFLLILSLILLVRYFNTPCFTLQYLIIYYIINIILIIEFILRINVLGKHYWESKIDLKIDLVLLPLSVYRVIIITIDKCIVRNAKIIDDFVFMYIIALQIFRIIVMFQNNKLFSSEEGVIDIECIENDDRELMISQVSDSATIITGNDNMEYLLDIDEDDDLIL